MSTPTCPLVHADHPASAQCRKAYKRAIEHSIFNCHSTIHLNKFVPQNTHFHFCRLHGCICAQHGDFDSFDEFSNYNCCPLVRTDHPANLEWTKSGIFSYRSKYFLLRIFSRILADFGFRFRDYILALLHTHHSLIFLLAYMYIVYVLHHLISRIEKLAKLMVFEINFQGSTSTTR